MTMTRRAVLWILALGAAGCAGGPGEIDTSPFRPPSPLRAKAAFVFESTVPRQVDRAAEACSVPLDAEEARKILLEPLVSLDVFQTQEIVKTGEGLDSDFLVFVRASNHRVKYHGRNRWWIPNLVVWFLVLVPSWWVPDETFAAELTVEVSVTETRTGKIVFSKEINASAIRHLNDLDRGWSLLAIVDNTLDEDNYREAARHLDLDLWEKIVPSALEALGVEFTREMAAAKWAPEGTTRALVVGVGEEGNLSDADRMASYLRGPGGIPRENIVLIKAGWEEVLQALAKAPESRPYERVRKTLDEWRALPFPERDRVFLYFSGQGTLMPDGAPAIVTETGGEGRVRLTRILDSLARFSASTVVIDAGFRAEGGVRSFRGGGKADLEAFEKMIEASPATLILAAPPGAEGLESPKAGTGVCTDYVLKAAQGRADRDADGTTTPAELIEYLKAQLRGFALILGREAQPYVRAPGRDWLPAGEK
jgi:hypothetical protein